MQGDQLDRALHNQPGVVDQRVEPSGVKPPGDLASSRRDRRLVTDVESDRNDGVTPTSQLLAGRGDAHAREHLPAEFVQPASCGAADAARRAGDEDRLGYAGELT